MLTHFTLKNYKPISLIELELSPMSVFIGPNDSGKSSILQAVRYASQIASGRPLEDIFTGTHQLEHLHSQTVSEPIYFEFAGHSSEVKTFKWSFELSNAEFNNNRYYILNESSRIGDENLSHPKQARQSNLTDELACLISSAVYLHLDPSQLKQPSYSEEDSPKLEYDGNGLPSVLAAMQGLTRDRFDELEERFTKIVPTVKRILLGPGPVYKNETETIRIDNEAVTRTKRRRYTGHHLFFDTVSGNRIPAPHMSDGSMLILGYLTALLSDTRPNLILLEEPENGIHPKALEPFITFFRHCMDQENIQILMSSHSPYLIDYLNPDEIILTRRESGFTQAVRMDKLPDIKQWMENLSTGELWTMGGEDELIRRIHNKKAEHE